MPVHPSIEMLTWKDIRGDVMKVNAEFAAEIDKLDPGPEYSLFKIKYPFGQHILHQGLFYLPNKKNTFVPVHDPSISSKIKKALQSSLPTPLGLVLNNNLESFLDVGHRVIPYSVISPGKLFSLWDALQNTKTSKHNKSILGIMSGARSLIMLPKISDMALFRKLKKEFNFTQTTPADLSDQWPIFQELANNSHFPQPWYSEVLFFSDKWLEKSANPSWQWLRSYLVENAWVETDYLRNQIIHDIVFSCALDNRNLRPNPFLVDTVKHIYAVGTGGYPGFTIAKNDQSGPVAAFKKIFADVYGLKYAPTMMHCEHLSNSNEINSVYYSLQIPTLMDFQPRSKKLSTKFEELLEIKHIINATTKDLLEDKLNLQGTSIHDIASNLEYKYYHSNKDSIHNILHTSTMPKYNEDFQMDLAENKKPFCDTSAFIRGCVQISKKK